MLLEVEIPILEQLLREFPLKLPSLFLEDVIMQERCGASSAACFPGPRCKSLE
jgi:hypothetical protein